MTNPPNHQDWSYVHVVDPVTAFAHEPCQITHAHATSCLIYTCAHQRRC